MRRRRKRGKRKRIDGYMVGEKNATIIVVLVVVVVVVDCHDDRGGGGGGGRRGVLHYTLTISRLPLVVLIRMRAVASGTCTATHRNEVHTGPLPISLLQSKPWVVIDAIHAKPTGLVGHIVGAEGLPRAMRIEAVAYVLIGCGGVEGWGSGGGIGCVGGTKGIGGGGSTRSFSDHWTPSWARGNSGGGGGKSSGSHTSREAASSSGVGVGILAGVASTTTTTAIMAVVVAPGCA